MSSSPSSLLTEKEATHLKIAAQQIRNRKCKDLYGFVIFAILGILAITLTGTAQFSTQFKRLSLFFLKGDELSRACGLNVAYSSKQPDPRYPFLTSVFDLDQLVLICEVHKNLNNFASDYCDKLKTQGGVVNQSHLVQFMNDMKPFYQETQNTLLITPQGDSVCVPWESCVSGVNQETGLQKAYVCDSVVGSYLNYFIQVGQTEASLVSQTALSQYYSVNEYSVLVSSFPAPYRFIAKALCHSLGASKYSATVVGDDFKQCQVPNGNQIEQKLSIRVQVPGYVSYVLNYFSNVKMYIFNEIIESGTGILIGAFFSILLAYLVVLLIMKLTTYVFWFLFIGLVMTILIAGVAMLITTISSIKQQSVLTQIFEVQQTSSLLLIVLCCFIGIVLIVLSIVVALYILYKKRDIQNAAYGVKLSWFVYRKRLRLFFFPLVFVVLQCGNIAFLVIFITGMLVAGRYDIRLGLFSFSYLDANYNIKPMAQETAATVFLVLYTVASYYVISASFQYFVASLTFSWYNDRISVTNSRAKLSLLKPDSPKVQKRISQKRKELGGDKLVTVHDIDIGSQRSYFLAIMDYFKSFGTICLYGLTNVILLLPKLLFKLLLLVNDYFSSNLIIGQFQRHPAYVWYVKNVLRTVINCSSGDTILYSSLTGDNYWTSQKRSKLPYQCNTEMLNKIVKASNFTTAFCKFMVSIIAMFVSLIKGEATISALVCTFMLSWLCCGFVLNLPHFMNVSLVYAYNFDLVTGTGQKQQLMPAEMRTLVLAYQRIENGDEDFHIDEILDEVLLQRTEFVTQYKMPSNRGLII